MWFLMMSTTEFLTVCFCEQVFCFYLLAVEIILLYLFNMTASQIQYLRCFAIKVEPRQLWAVLGVGLSGEDSVELDRSAMMGSTWDMSLIDWIRYGQTMARVPYVTR